MRLADPKELFITRTFDAPCALVWQAMASPQNLLHWWGPRHHPAVNVEWDMRVGGRWRNCLRAVDTGDLLWHGGEFREVQFQQRLAFTFTWEELGERGLETLVTLNFSEHQRKTTMTLHQTPFQSAVEQDGHSEGWNSTFDRLVEHLTTLL